MHYGLTVANCRRILSARQSAAEVKNARFAETVWSSENLPAVGIGKFRSNENAEVVEKLRSMKSTRLRKRGQLERVWNIAFSSPFARSA